MKKVVSCGVFAAFLVLYLATLRPGVLPADSGEFQLAATQLKIAHPPGFPLYVALGWLFTLLPGSAASNLNFLSAITSSLTLAFIPLILSEMPQSRIINRYHKWMLVLGSVVGAALLGMSTTFWSQATTTNIRSLTTLFAAYGIFLVMRWVRRMIDEPTADQRNFRLLLMAVAVMSLGVTHHLSLAFFAVIMGVVVCITRWRWLLELDKVGKLSLALAVGLVPWILILIREPSLRNPALFFTYVSGLGFGADFFFIESLSELIIRFRVMWNVVNLQFHWLVLVGAGISLMLLTYYRWRLVLLLGGSFFTLALIAATYRAPQTVEYMLPAYLPIVIGFSWLITMSAHKMAGTIAAWSDTPLDGGWILVAIVCVGGIFGSFVQLQPTWDSYFWLARQHDTADYTNSILRDAPENAVVLSSWHWFTPLSYLQQVEGVRPDLEIVYVDPTYNNDWAGAIHAQLEQGLNVVATNYSPQMFESLPAHVPIGDAFLWRQDPIASLDEAKFDPLILNLDGMVQVHGLKQYDTTVPMAETANIDVVWSIPSSLPAGLKLFVHLVGGDGSLYAQEDLAVTAQLDGLSITRFELTPRPGVPLGPARILLGAYLADGTPLLNVAGEPSTEIGQIRIVGTRWRPVTLNRQNEFDPNTGWRLVGVDTGTDLGWQNASSGQSKVYRHWQMDNGLYWTSVEEINDPNIRNAYVPLGDGITWLGVRGRSDVEPGSAIDVVHRFAADRPVMRDYGLAVRQVGYGSDNFTWAWLNPDPDNDIPAAGAIPSLKWIAGTRVDHIRRLTIPNDALPGQLTEGFLRPYDVFTQEPLPILDERATADGRPWIRYRKTQVQHP
ncbi:MAG: MFS transporter [Chloroflexota bacterium]